MSVDSDVRRFLDRWAATTASRDVTASAELFLRDPAPLVVFSDGERAQDWLDVRVRLERDYGHAIIEGIDVHDVQARDLGSNVLLVSFGYWMRARDMWGVATTSARRASMTLVRTKEGLRIAGEHFARGE